jgi:hypothetical protein
MYVLFSSYSASEEIRGHCPNFSSPSHVASRENEPCFSYGPILVWTDRHVTSHQSPWLCSLPACKVDNAIVKATPQSRQLRGNASHLTATVKVKLSLCLTN